MADENAVTVTVRYFAGARAASGIPQETRECRRGITVGALLEELNHAHGMRLSRVLSACSFLLDGRAIRDLDTAIYWQAELDILPPFAGG